MRVAKFTIEFGGSSRNLPHVPIWAYDQNDTAKAWELIRRKGFGSYANGPGTKSVCLEEYDSPDDRARIDKLLHLSWVAWAAHELRSILDGPSPPV